jgi:hypothetical protein
LEERGFLLLLCGIGRLRRRGWVADERRLGFQFTDVIETGVASDLVHPGTEGSARPIGLAVSEDAQEDVLDEIFAGGAVLGHFGVEVEQRGLVAVEQHA